MFESIRNKTSVYMPQLRELYEAAFPVAERREFEQLLALLEEPDMHLHAALEQQQLAGFCIFWELPGFLFVEHLAVVPEQRGLGLGTKIVKWLQRKASGKPLFLEVERPVTDTARKRIVFYERLGFTLYPTFDYLQPAYSRSGQQVPLYLMSTSPPSSKADLIAKASLIKSFVYEQFYT
ncbi:GNAT family N-acetyltransferase [Pontibacter qinzhouensis]|uniref:GNAT family N-acetyltransferase n=1 Tax=Pontibacter qinzhouensis TaxID=2603253 RepID=A0A5C8KD60_9BACT|nr:GNAT family N-acetyltransferase [Pontibacter qinzhouensis]TXK49812.1 GNAT family N-acetyltransferase [Pontibacter qinzhouensis]